MLVAFDTTNLRNGGDRLSVQRDAIVVPPRRREGIIDDEWNMMRNERAC